MDQPQAAVPVAVIGVGRMGRHHARTLAKMPRADLVGVVDGDAERAGQAAEEYGTEAFPSLDALLERHAGLRAAVVAVPTVFHADAARPLLERGIACLIEKPLAGSSREARELADFADQHGALLQVGHTERFNPVVRAVSALGLTPRFLDVTRISPMTFRSMDVGVVMDMMIHDLDIVLSLVGRPLERVEAVGCRVLGEHEDLCDARLFFEGGCVANLHGSRMATGTERRLRLFSEAGYVSLDYGERTGTFISTQDHAEAMRDIRSRLKAGEDLSGMDYLELLKTRPLDTTVPAGEDDPLTAQATAFLASVTDGRPPVVSAADGCAAVEAAERIVASIRD
jgi:predicted dehydrogenase